MSFENLEEAACNYCGGKDFRLRFHSPMAVDGSIKTADYMASTDVFGRYGRIVSCRQCGLVFTAPRIREEEVMKAYKSQWNREDSKHFGGVVAGSIYGGVMFNFKNGKVSRIFLGAAAE